MKTLVQQISLAAGSTLWLATSTCTVLAQQGPENAPLSYVADPKVYHLISENDQFRVVEVTRPAGFRDAWHSHGKATVVYNLTECQTRLHLPDGKSTGGTAAAKAGSVVYNGPIPSHSAENVGSAECRQLLVELK
jgi:hypothetical protein